MGVCSLLHRKGEVGLLHQGPSRLLCTSSILRLQESYWMSLNFSHASADKNVIHGDLKSKNVLLTRNFTTAKLSDVGMARVHASTVRTGVRYLPLLTALSTISS